MEEGADDSDVFQISTDFEMMPTEKEVILANRSHKYLFD